MGVNVPSLLILCFLFWFVAMHPKRFCKSNLFLKFCELHERSSDIAFLMQPPVYSNFKMYSVLILVFFKFCFAIFHPTWICMSQTFFLKFDVLREGSDVIASFVEHHVYSNFKLYSVLILFLFYFDLPLFTKSALKIFLFLKFYVILFLSCCPLYKSNIKMYSALILVFLFCFATFHSKCLCRSNLYSVLGLAYLFIFATFHQKWMCISDFSLKF